MYPVVQRSFQKLQRQKDGLLAEVSTWPAELLSFRPKPESWSTLNVLDHLVRVERGWLHSVRQNLRSGKSVTIGDRLATFAVIAIMRSPLKVKVPGSVTTILPKDETLSNIAANWDRTREQMSKLLAGVSPNQAKYGVFPHPVGGCMNLPQSIDFLCAHLQHHKWQIKRLRRAAKHRPRQ